jgi:hypothetical protein
MTVVINLTASPAALVTGIGQCVVDALAQTPAGAPCRQCLLLSTATIPWDGCDCECDTSSGQIAQAILSVGAADNIATGEFTGNWKRCIPAFTIVRVMLSVVRCVPSMDERGTPPACADELAAAITLENDRTAVRQALACCIDQLMPPTLLTGPVRAFNIGPSVTVGESGACAGIETVYTLALSAPCVCDR